MQQRLLFMLILSLLPFSTAFAVDCISGAEEQEKNFQYLLRFSKQAIKEKDWSLSQHSEEVKSITTWMNKKNGAILHLEYLIYVCGYTREVIDEYYSDKGFSVIFSGYQDVKKTAQCSNGNRTLDLYEFSMKFNGRDYLSHYWVRLDNDYHVLSVMLVAPLDSASELDGVSRRMFPSLAACPAGAR